MIDHLVTPRSMKDIREIVNAIKIHFGFYDCLKFPIMFFWEHIIPIIFPDYRFLYVEDDELKGVEAYTDHNLRLVKVKVSVYERALNGSPKDLFTIVHETGHLFMHDGEAMIFARTSERSLRIRVLNGKRIILAKRNADGFSPNCRYVD